MEIKNIKISNEGYVKCQSTYYSVQDGMDSIDKYIFSSGINRMIGEIDSGIWAVSYLLSMYEPNNKNFIFLNPPCVEIDNHLYSVEEILKLSCYMDKSYPLFSQKESIKSLVETAINQNKLDKTAEEIRQLFCIDAVRFERPLTGVGNEIFKAMAAIGYCNKKQIFCFPWLSKKRFDGFHGHLTGLLEILETLNVIVILPVGRG